MTSRPPAIPTLSIHHFSVSVPDLNQALAWYSDILGFSEEMRFAIDVIGAQGAFMVREGLRIELWQIAGGAPVPLNRREPDMDLRTGGTKHVALLVADLQSCLRELIARGVDVAAVQRNPTEPMMSEQNPLDPAKPPAFAAFIRDPAGTLIELLDHQRVTAMHPG